MGSKKHTILYIEDDPANRQLVKFIFDRRDDLLLIAAETGSSGLKLAREELPDIVLLDLSLPDISGFEVLKKLKEAHETSHIPVIAISGDNLPEDIAKGLSAGFQNYLGKPISVENLYRVIDNTLSELPLSK